MRISMKMILGLGAVLALAIPPVVFLGSAVQAGLGLGESLSAMVAQYREPRQNLLVCGALGLFPIGLLTVGLWVIKRLAPAYAYRGALAIGGCVPIMAVLVWVNLDFWPLFLPARTYPGFPHGLGFVIGPLIFAPVGMAIGVAFVWLAARRGA